MTTLVAGESGGASFGRPFTEEHEIKNKREKKLMFYSSSFAPKSLEALRAHQPVLRLVGAFGSLFSSCFGSASDFVSTCAFCFGFGCFTTTSSETVSLIAGASSVVLAFEVLRGLRAGFFLGSLEASSEALFSTFASFTAVSYTHLDVYKRQVQGQHIIMILLALIVLLFHNRKLHLLFYYFQIKFAPLIH